MGRGSGGWEWEEGSERIGVVCTLRHPTCVRGSRTRVHACNNWKLTKIWKETSTNIKTLSYFEFKKRCKRILLFSQGYFNYVYFNIKVTVSYDRP